MGQIVSGDDVVVTGKEPLSPKSKVLLIGISTSDRNRLFDEETNQYYKYLAFSLNFSSNCDYNNR